MQNTIPDIINIFILPKLTVSNTGYNRGINRIVFDHVFSDSGNISAQGPPSEPAYFLNNNLNILGIHGSVYKEPFFVAMERCLA